LAAKKIQVKALAAKKIQVKALTVKNSRRKLWQALAAKKLDHLNN